jgi:hypothetical protein
MKNKAHKGYKDDGRLDTVLGAKGKKAKDRDKFNKTNRKRVLEQSHSKICP